MGTTRLERLDDPTDADGVAYHQLIVAAEAVDRPEDPPPDLAEIAGRLRARRDDRRVLRWVVRGGDGMLGHVVLMLPDLDNQHLAMANVTVHPDRRRRGLGTALLRAAVAAAAVDGRRTLLIEAFDGGAGEAFCRAHGFATVGRERLSLLRLADVDRADVEALAAATHAGYRLVRWTDRCPDELVEQFALAKAAMNDAPVDDADMGGRVYTAEVIRQDEADRRTMGLTAWTTVAVHESTGAVAGLTELLLGPPPRAFQEDTAVVPAHRGSGLGLWVKADMLCRLQAERPDVTEVVTGNAASNEHMLRINTRLGFRPHRTLAEWQGDVPALASRLGAGNPADPVRTQRA
jgi:GNAT superfamily N-acetyltransferase